jgi:hypothetical protein
MLLRWRGNTYEVDLDAEATYGPLRGTHAAVWAPSCDPLLLQLGHRSDQWLAELVVIGHPASFKAYGSTAQKALDALAAIVPVPISRGGAC